MLSKITKIILILAGFLLILNIAMSAIDADLGWHLRFGMDTFAGKFPYTDTYTWSYSDQAWNNHEWGSDILFWLIYANGNFLALGIFIAALIWSSFLLVLKIFTGKLSILSILLAILGIWSLVFVFAVRPAFIVLILFPPLLYTLTALPKKNLLFTWPIIFWLWSVLHGSWFVGFIIVFIYIGGNLLNLMLKKYLPKFSGKDTGWSFKTVFISVIWLIISAVAILINPYGVKIYSEIAAYLLPGAYFKTIINEWVPSYTYPVYILPLIFGSVAAVFAVIGYMKKRVSLAEFLLFFAFFYAAWSYKRNNLYLVLFSLPVISVTLTEAWKKIIPLIKPQKKYQLNKAYLFVATALGIIMIVLSVRSTHLSKNIWSDPVLLARRQYPLQAVEFLKAESLKNKILLFNEFRWGGYLNWTLPEALVYLDGRGTVTWHDNAGTNLMEEYRKIKFEINGLKKLESSEANYVLLIQNFSSYPKPDLINSLLFEKDKIENLFQTEESQLEKMLARSNYWNLVYEDRICRIWKKK